MSRLRKSLNRCPIIESSASESEETSPSKRLKLTQEKKNTQKEHGNESSSSESDIENYLQPVDKLDFSSSFFNLHKNNHEEFNKIKNKIFDGVPSLSDSEPDHGGEINESQSKTNESHVNKNSIALKLNFQHLEDFTRKIEETKLEVEKYNARKKIREKKQDISHLLTAGENKQISLEKIKGEYWHSSDFESTDDEWEEVKVNENVEKSIIPKKNIEIQVDHKPEHMKKKKGLDLLAAVKRRLNRIRKENQIYVHKVHLLCWIAHGNFLNSVINNSDILAMSLSLLPSANSFPSDRPDLGYLEQIVQWYKKIMRLTEKLPQQELPLLNSLKLEISKKEAFSKNTFILIFVSMLRAMGIACRLVLSFQVKPLRPPSSELHSLSTKDSSKNKSKSASSTSISKLEASCSKKSNIGHTVSKGKSILNRSKINKTKESKSIDKNSNQDKSLSTTKGRASKQKDVEKEMPTACKGTRSTAAKGIVKESIKHINIKISSEEGSTKLTVKKKTDRENKIINESSESCLKKSSIESVINKEKKSEVKRQTRSANKEKAAHTTADDLSVDSKKPSSNTSNVEDLMTTAAKNIKKTVNIENKKLRTKCESIGKTSQTSKIQSKASSAVIKIKLPKYPPKKKSEEKKIPQLDGANDKIKGRSSQKGCAVKKNASYRTSSNDDDDSENEFSASPLKKLPQKGKIKSILQTGESSSSVSNPFDIKNDIINLIKGRISEQKSLDKRRMANKRPSYQNDSNSDSDYMPEPIHKKKHNSDSDVEYFAPKPKVKRRIKVKKEGDKLKVLSSDDETQKKKKGVNIWLEVFLESEEKWISVDVIRGQVHCVNELFMRASHPVSYIIAWNNDNTLKDVTKRYCKNFNTITRKLRVDEKWWEESLKPFLENNTARSKEEDDDLNRQQLDQPMPKIISEYKNHPLYALRRHLLKFEAIYPPDILPLGYVRGEPVYPRNSVYVCRSREIWVKEAKVVKLGEQPYKIVKARPKYDKLSNQLVTGQNLELFGEWQTTDYEPPTATNGIVPRNAYGNVELFKTCMLPKGTVQLKLPGLNKICRKLNIDCASAVVGFDFHGGWSHPVYDGFVVCKEYEDTCIAAWHQEQEELEKKENEKYEKRVYTNWKKLINGLLIRERLKARYDFETSEGRKVKQKSAKGPRFATKK